MVNASHSAWAAVVRSFAAKSKLSAQRAVFVTKAFMTSGLGTLHAVEPEKQHRSEMQSFQSETLTTQTLAIFALNVATESTTCTAFRRKQVKIPRGRSSHDVVRKDCAHDTPLHD